MLIGSSICLYETELLGYRTMEYLDRKIIEIESRLEQYQSEYWDILIELIDNPEKIITDKKPKYFWIEKLKELQLSINHCSNYVREVSLDRAKSALEQAFTPKIRDTLIDQYRKKIDELENE